MTWPSPRCCRPVRPPAPAATTAPAAGVGWVGGRRQGRAAPCCCWRRHSFSAGGAASSLLREEGVFLRAGLDPDLSVLVEEARVVHHDVEGELLALAGPLQDLDA